MYSDPFTNLATYRFGLLVGAAVTDSRVVIDLSARRRISYLDFIGVILRSIILVRALVAGTPFLRFALELAIRQTFHSGYFPIGGYHVPIQNDISLTFWHVGVRAGDSLIRRRAAYSHVHIDI